MANKAFQFSSIKQDELDSHETPSPFMLLFWLKIPWITLYNLLALAKFERLDVWSSSVKDEALLKFSFTSGSM